MATAEQRLYSAGIRISLLLSSDLSVSELRVELEDLRLTNGIVLDLHYRPSLEPPTENLTSLIELILKNNYFTFNNEFYRQIQGTAMDTKIAPSYPTYSWRN
jgi:hypothetical protein